MQNHEWSRGGRMEMTPTAHGSPSPPTPRRASAARPARAPRTPPRPTATPTGLVHAVQAGRTFWPEITMRGLKLQLLLLSQGDTVISTETDSNDSNDSKITV
jgi:hypothetical protein